MSLTDLMAPTCLAEVYGQDHAKKAIQSWIDKDSFPRKILLTGPVGTGKSSLALIIAQACQGPEGYEGADIRQINAGSVGKVDDMRALAAESASRPFSGRYRVFILEEAHRVTDAAADALLVPMETNESTIWILTSSVPKDLPESIRSRCSAATFELKPLTKQQMIELCEIALNAANPAGDWDSDSIASWLYEKEVRQPREILGAMDLWFSGLPFEQCINRSEHEPLYKDVAGAVLRGDWAKTSGLLSQIKSADCRGMVGITSSFLRTELLKNPVGGKADALAVCLLGLDNLGYADGTAYGAVTSLLYKVCAKLGAK